MLKRLPLFCQETGYSEKAVQRKIEDGKWTEGEQYVRAPDGRILVDIDGFNKWALGEQRWAERQQQAESSSANAASASASRGAAGDTRRS